MATCRYGRISFGWIWDFSIQHHCMANYSSQLLTKKYSENVFFKLKTGISSSWMLLVGSQIQQFRPHNLQYSGTMYPMVANIATWESTVAAIRHGHFNHLTKWQTNRYFSNPKISKFKGITKQKQPHNKQIQIYTYTYIYICIYIYIDYHFPTLLRFAMH